MTVLTSLSPEQLYKCIAIQNWGVFWPIILRLKGQWIPYQILVSVIMSMSKTH